MFGHDPGTTLQECLAGQAFAASAIAVSPITNTFKTFSSALGSTRDMIGNLSMVSGGMTGMFTNSFGKIMSQMGNIGSSVQFLVIKLETLLQRLVAIITVIMYTMATMMQGVLAIKRDGKILDAVDTVLSFPAF